MIEYGEDFTASDGPSHRIAQHGLTGLKVADTAGAWYEAMKSAVEMPEEERMRIRARALARATETSLLAAALHRKTRQKRGDDGWPVMVMFMPDITGIGGGGILMWRRMELVRQLGLRPLVVINQWCAKPEDVDRVSRLFTEQGIEYELLPYNVFFLTPESSILPRDDELAALREFFSRRQDRLALAWSLAFAPAVGQACAEFGVPHVASLYGVDDDYALPDGGLPFKYCDVVQSDSIRYAKKWSSLFESDWVCNRDAVPETLFDVGFEKLYVQPERTAAKVTLSMAGTFMSRKSQLEVINSLLFLDKAIRDRVELHLYGGLDVYPEYGQECRRAIEEATAFGVRVCQHSHVRDITPIYEQADIVLSVSSFESFPNPIKEATAAGCLVIASQVGGITELMVDDVNCFLVDRIDPVSIARAITRAVSAGPKHLLAIRRNAFALAMEEFHPRRAMYDLASVCNLCLDSHPPGEARSPVAKRPAGLDDRALPAGGYRLAAGQVRYSVVPECSGWSGIDVWVETHPGLAGHALDLCVFSAAGGLLRRVSAELSPGAPRRRLSFAFAPIVNAAGQTILLEFSLGDAGPDGRIGLYETGAPTLRERRKLPGLLGGGVRKGLHCCLRYDE